MDLLFVVLAGNDSDPRLLGGAGGQSKFFMPFGDERVAERIIRALDSSTRCRAISIAAPPAEEHTFASQTRSPVLIAGQGVTSMESLGNAIALAHDTGVYSAGDYVLIVAGDLPLITGKAVDRFIAACEQQPPADCYVGMVPASVVADDFRAMVDREALTFRRKRCLHADVYLLRPSSISSEARHHIADIVSVRRTARTSARGFLQTLRIVLRIVGIRGLVPFAQVIAAISARGQTAGSGVVDAPSALETSVLELIEQGLGFTLHPFFIEEPVLAYGFDLEEDLAALRKYHGSPAGNR
jgi:molybdopterin-guanine dinucleotide biosynthesis protein A